MTKPRLIRNKTASIKTAGFDTIHKVYVRFFLEWFPLRIAITEEDWIKRWYIGFGYTLGATNYCVRTDGTIKGFFRTTCWEFAWFPGYKWEDGNTIGK
jgi:hypothetical protein